MCALDDLANKMCDEPIAYDLGQPFVAHVSIYKQQPTSEVPNGGPVLASCTTSLELDDSEGLRDLTSAIAKSKDGVWANFEGMNNEVKAVHKVGDPVFSQRVTAIHNIVDPVFSQLGTQLKMSIAILKWRYGLTDGPFNSFSNWSEAVSLDGTAWRGISTLRGFRIDFSHPARTIGLSALHETGRLHNERAEPPLGLQLLVEAWNQRTTHPRSALVIGVTAAEIALKQLIGELAPGVQWLIDNVPSPPIFKIARDYVPTLRVKARLIGKTLRPPKPLLKRLDNAVELRNKVVHAGKAPPEPEKLKKILVAMEDLVWICELYKGHTWAWDHISFETKSAWEDE
jgi:hypothetical protein